MSHIQLGYKQTDNGLIPEDWEIKTVGEVANITTGNKNTQDKTDEGQYPFFVRSQIIERINSYSYDGEGVLTAGDGVGTGKVFHYINGKFDFHQRVYLIHSFDKKLDGKYFYWYFSKYFYDRISQLTAKSSVDSVRREMISEMLISLPSFEEQTDIATALSDINALISALDKRITKKQQIKQGTMQQLLTGKKRLTGFSGDWIEKRLGEMAEIKDGTHQTPKYVDDGVPFYSVESVTNSDFRNVKMVSPEEHKLLTKTFKIEKGDVLMTRIGSIGVCKYIDWEPEASFYVSLALLKFKKEYSPLFFVHYSQISEFIQEIEEHSLQHATPKKINLGKILLIKVNVPSTLSEQTAIAEILTDMDSEITQLETERDKYKQIKAGMMQQLLTGKIRLTSNQ